MGNLSSNENYETSFLISSNQASVHEVVKVTTKKPINYSELQQVTKEICLKHLNAGEVLKEISLNEDGRTFTINSHSNVLKKEGEKTAAIDDLTVKIIEVSQQTLPKRLKTLTEIYHGLQKTWPAKVPIINLFWSISIFPLTLFVRCFSPKLRDLTELNAQESPRDEDALLTALKWSQSIFSLEAEKDPLQELGSEFTLGAQLKEAENFSREWRTSSNSASIQKLSSTISARAEKLDNEQDVKKTEKAINLMIVPTGYWKEDGNYQPVLLSFYRNAEKKICLSEMTYGEKTGPTFRDFKWKEQPDEQTLFALLNTLVPLSAKPIADKGLDLPDVAGLGYVSYVNLKNERFKDGFAKPSPSTLLSKPTGIENFREKILMAVGAEVDLSRVEQRRFRVKEDPWKLIQETIRLQFPEAPLADKCVFTLGMLSDRLEKVISGLDDMEPAQRDKWLHQLQHDWKSFERRLTKTLGNEEAFAKLLNEDSPFSKLGKRLAELETEVEHLNALSVKGRQTRLDHLNHTESQDFAIQVPTKLTAIGTVTPANLKTSLITAKDLEMVATVKLGFEKPTAENLPKTLEALETLAARLDSLVDAKAYADVNQLYRAVIKHLPLPALKGSQNAFWDLLKQQATENGQLMLLDKLSGSLTQLAHYSWESKIKTWDVPLKPDEWVHTLNLEQNLYQLIKFRQEIVKDKVLNSEIDDDELKTFVMFDNTQAAAAYIQFIKPDSWSALKNLGISYDDLACVMIKDASDVDKFMWLGKIDREEHLRPAQSTDLEEKILCLRQFASEIGMEDVRPKIYLDAKELKRRIGKEREEAKALSDLWQYYHAEPKQLPKQLPEELPEQLEDIKSKALESSEVYEISAASMIRQNNSDQPAFPGQIADYYKQQMMNRTLYYPETGIGIFGVNLKGAGAYGGLLFNNLPGDELRKKMVGKVRAQLSGLNRLDLNSYQFRVFGVPAVVHHGIIERGAKPTSNPAIAIGADGLTDYFAKLGTDANDEAQRDALGDPKAPFCKSTINPMLEDLTEATALSKELSRPDGTVESWLLDGIEIKVQEPSHKGGRALFSFRNVQEAFDLALQKFYFLDQPDAQRRLYMVCFRPHLIQRLLRNNPDYFIQQAPKIKLAIEKALSEGHPARASYLLWLNSQIVFHAKACLKAQKEEGNDLYVQSFGDSPVDAGKLNELIEKLPHLNSNLTIKDKEVNATEWIMKWINNPKTGLEDQLSASSYLLSFIASNPDNNLDEQPLLADPKQLVNFLALSNRLKGGSDSCSLPTIAQTSTLWMDETLSPWLNEKMNKSGEYRNTVLNEYVKQTENDPFSQGVWQRIGATNTWKRSDGTEIDCDAMRLMKFKGKPSKGQQVNFPKAISNSVEFNELFEGKELHPRLVAGDKPSQLIYYFSYSTSEETNQNYRVVYDKQDQSVLIERKFSEAWTHGDKSVWLRFIKPSAKETNSTSPLQSMLKKLDKVGIDTSKFPIHSMNKQKSELYGIEKTMSEKGVWLNPKNPRQGLAVLSSDITKAEQNKSFLLSFNSQGVLQKTKTLGGLEVVHDPKERLISALGPVHENQIVFLSKKGASSVSEIRILSNGMTLKQVNQPPVWMVTEGPYKGYQWIMGGVNTPVEKLLKPLGSNIEQFGMAFVHPETKDAQFIMWPNAIQTLHAHKRSENEPLSFIKDEGLSAPLKLSFADNGSLITTSSGHLYLAYLFAAKHDYQRASHYLKEAEKTRAQLNKPEDFETLDKISEAFQLLNADTVRSHVIKLKAQLQIRSIIRLQTTIPEFQKNKWKEFLKDARYVNDLYAGYKERRAHPPIPTHPVFLEKEANGLSKSTSMAKDRELDLSEEEQVELRHISKESMDFMMAKVKRLEAMTPQEKTLWVEKSKSLITTPTLVQLLLTRAVDAPRDSKDLFARMHNPTADFIVNEFFNLWNLIVKENIKIDDPRLLPLFNSLSGLTAEEVDAAINLAKGQTNGDKKEELLKKAASQGVGKAFLIQADFARKMLLSLASLSDDQRKETKPFDVANLRHVQKSLPKGPASFVFKTLLSFLFKNKNDGLRNASYEILTNFNAIFDDPSASELAVFGSARLDATSVMKDQAMAAARPKEQISLRQLQEAAKEDPYLFGPETQVALLALNQIDPDMATKLEGPEAGLLTIEKLVEKIEQQQGHLNAVEKLREAEIGKRVKALEAKYRPLSTEGQPQLQIEHSLNIKSDDPILNADGLIKKPFQSLSAKLDGYLSAIDADSALFSEDNLTKMQRDYNAAIFSAGQDKIEQTENEKLTKGMEAAAKELASAQAKTGRIVNKTQLNELETFIAGQFESNQTQAAKSKEKILTLIKSAQNPSVLPEDLRWALANQQVIGDEELLERVLDSYQSFGFNNLSEGKVLEREVSLFLFYQVAAQQTGKPAQTLINELKALKNQESSLLPVDQESWKQEWNLASSELIKTIQAVSSLATYLDEAGGLKEPVFTRKFLVTESRTGIILRQEQIDIIHRMVNNPDDWYELRMGLGKTSFILPITLAILAEKGMLPVALIKEGLLRQNLTDLDISTRLMIKKAGAEFQFNISSSTSPVTLAEQYCKLLEVKENKGYIVSTVTSKASLIHKLGLLNQEQEIAVQDLLATKEAHEMEGKLKEVLTRLIQNQMAGTGQSNLENELSKLSKEEKEDLQKNLKILAPKLETIDHLQKQMFWLAKIRLLLDGDGKTLGFRTQTIGDEVDDIFNILFENNVALGGSEALEPVIVNVMEAVMRELYTSPDPQLARVRLALERSEQDALLPADIEQNILPALAASLYDNKEFRRLIGGTGKDQPEQLDEEQENVFDVDASLDVIGKEEFVKFICHIYEKGESSKLGALLKKGDNETTAHKAFRKNLQALKTIMQTSIKNALAQGPLAVGFKEANGFVVGPKVAGREKAGAVFGDEFDVDANHYLLYSQRFPESDFMKSALKQFQVDNPQAYQDVQDRMERKSITEFLLAPGRVEARQDALESLLIDIWIEDIFKIEAFKITDIIRSRAIHALRINNKDREKFLIDLKKNHPETFLSLVGVVNQDFKDQADQTIGQFLLKSENLPDLMKILSRGDQKKLGETQEQRQKALAKLAKDPNFVQNNLPRLVKELEDNNPALYATLMEKTKQSARTMLTFLNEKENWSDRLQLLREIIIGNLLIKRNKEQMKLPVQEAVAGTHVGGMTGTLNKRVLPNLLTNASADQSSQTERAVEGETLLRIKAKEPGFVQVVDQKMS